MASDHGIRAILKTMRAMSSKFHFIILLLDPRFLIDTSVDNYTLDLRKEGKRLSMVLICQYFYNAIIYIFSRYCVDPSHAEYVLCI
jgi:hypothetical protein